MKAPTLSHRLQHLLFMSLSTVVRWLPERLTFGLGSVIGWLAGSVFRIRRSVVEENLARAFPEKDGSWRRRVAAASYRHLAREAIELLRLHRMEREELLRRCEMVGFELARAALREGRGVLFLTGHLGNWELGGAVVAAHGIPLDVVARLQTNPLFNRELERTREGHGMRVIYRQDATRQVLQSLRASRGVALVADQNVASGGVFVDFFGEPAATARGPGLLAMRTGARVLVTMVRRLPGAKARYRMTFTPLPHPDTGEKGTDIEQFTRGYLGALEEAIKEAPEQYFWLHRRWKTRPVEELPSLGMVAGRKVEKR